MAELDPNIALSYRPTTALETPDQARTKALTLRDLMQQGQLRDQQLQSGSLQLQQQKQAMSDEQNMRKAYMDAGGDLEQTKQNAMKYGVSPKTIMALQSQIVDQKTKLATLDKTTLENQAAKNNQLAGVLDPVTKIADPNAQQQAWNAALVDAHSKGLMSTQEILQHPYPGPDGVKAYAAHLLTQDQITKQVQAESEAKKNTAQANEAQARLPGIAAQGQYEQLKAKGQAPIQPAEQATIDQSKATLANTQAYQQAELGQRAQGLKLEGQRVGIEAGGLRLRQTEYSDKKTGNDISPRDMTIGDQVAAGKVSVAALSRMPNKESILSYALNKNPGAMQAFDTTKAFTDPNSKTSQTLKAFNNITGHIQAYEDRSKDLGFSPALAVNHPSWSKGSSQLNVISQGIASELSKFQGGGEASDTQIKGFKEGLQSSRPEVRQAAIEGVKDLMSKQYESLDQAHKAGLGKSLDQTQYLTSSSKKWLSGATGKSSAGASIQDLRKKYNY